MNNRRVTAIGVLTTAAIAVACSESPTRPTQATLAWHASGISGPGRPGADGGTVYFLSAADSHMVHAFDALTGEERWSSSTGLTGAGRFTVGGCLLAREVVACGDGEAMVGFSRTNGQRLWTFEPTVGRSPGVLIGTVDVDSSTIYAPTPDNAVHAIDAATGVPRWSTTLVPGSNAVNAYKVVDGGDVVFAVFTEFANHNSGGLIALSKIDGAVQWVVPFTHPDSSAGAKDVALWRNFVLASLENGHIAAIDRSTHQVAWQLKGVGTAPAWFPGGSRSVGGDLRTLIVMDDRLLAISESGWVIAYDLPTQTELGRGTMTSAAGALWEAGADSKRAYFVSTGELLFGVDIANPAVVWLASPFATFITAPVISHGMVFVGGTTGYYGFRP